MSGIYSSLPPTHELPREPINAMRARNGERPLCWNREDYSEHVTVRAGIHADGRQQFAVVPNAMSTDCKAWAVREPDPNRPGDAGEDPAIESIPAREGWRCLGCRHLPPDPRVVACAEKNEGT